MMQSMCIILAALNGSTVIHITEQIGDWSNDEIYDNLLGFISIRYIFMNYEIQFKNKDDIAIRQYNQYTSYHI